MILCADCIVDVYALGNRCLDMLLDCIDLHNDNMVMAVDPSHLLWKLHRKEGLRPYKDLELALQLLEKNGYVISTEISERLLGVCLNMEKVVYDEEIGIICWCSRSNL